MSESTCSGSCLLDDVRARSGLADCLAGVILTVDPLQEKTEDADGVCQGCVRVCGCVLAVEFVLNKQKRLSPSHSFWLKTSDAVV